MNYLNAFFIFLLTLFTAFGDTFLKKAGQLKQTNFSQLAIGLVVYLITGLVWFLIYKQVKFSSVGSVYGVATALVFALVGIFYFKETVHLIELVGIAMAIISIVILGRFGN